jgi:hypothetical protein
MDITCKTPINTPSDFTVVITDDSNNQIYSENVNNNNIPYSFGISILTTVRSGYYIITSTTGCVLSATWTAS